MHDQIRTFDIFRTLSERLDLDAHIAYRLERFRLVVVRAGQVIALGMENLRQRIHTRTADADKMNSLYLA